MIHPRRSRRRLRHRRRCRAPRKNPAHFAVRIDGDKRMLEGKVSDQAIKTRLLQAASAAYGETHVVDKLVSRCANEHVEMRGKCRHVVRRAEDRSADRHRMRRAKAASRSAAARSANPTRPRANAGRTISSAPDTSIVNDDPGRRAAAAGDATRRRALRRAHAGGGHVQDRIEPHRRERPRAARCDRAVPKERQLRDRRLHRQHRQRRGQPQALEGARGIGARVHDPQRHRCGARSSRSATARIIRSATTRRPRVARAIGGSSSSEEVTLSPLPLAGEGRVRAIGVMPASS